MCRTMTTESSIDEIKDYRTFRTASNRLSDPKSVGSFMCFWPFDSHSALGAASPSVWPGGCVAARRAVIGGGARLEFISPESSFVHAGCGVVLADGFVASLATVPDLAIGVVWRYSIAYFRFTVYRTQLRCKVKAAICNLDYSTLYSIITQPMSSAMRTAQLPGTLRSEAPLFRLPVGFGKNQTVLFRNTVVN